MPGLFDFLATPEGQGLLSAVAGGMAGARRGAPINTIGGAGMAGLLGYGQAQERAIEAERYKKANALNDLKIAEANRVRQAQEAFRLGLPESDRGLFDVAPEKFVENAPQFQKPQLIEVADPQDPLRTIKVWAKPGQTSDQGTIAGRGQLPEILDPRVRAAKEGIARAGRSDTTIKPPAGFRFKTDGSLEAIPGGPGIEKPPSGYRRKEDGSLEPIPGGPEDPNKGGAPGVPKLTESQAKGALYLGQMRSATEELSKLPATTPLAASAARSTLTNWAAPENAQKVNQLQEQWAEAYLRAKTGAAATKEEININRRTFFPSVGDSDAVIKQKAIMREQAERDMVPTAGPAAPTAGVNPSRRETDKPPLAARDQEALDWANANPNDPRAAAIKTKLGR